MEFIKRMKKREFIEMGLKAVACILVAFLVIILMEGMIYGIELNALRTKGKTLSLNDNCTILYCIEELDDQYYVIAYNPETNRWSSQAIFDETGELIKNNLYSKSQCEAIFTSKVKEVRFGAPSAFEFSITNVHYIVMAVFVSAVAGFFVYKFIALAKEYKKIETTYEKTGTIELG